MQKKNKPYIHADTSYLDNKPTTEQKTNFDNQHLLVYLYPKG